MGELIETVRFNGKHLMSCGTQKAIYLVKVGRMSYIPF